MRRHYLVTYDISNDLRLRRVHAIVRDFGQAVQYSVFLARLNEAQRAELRRQLSQVIHHEEDQVLLFDLGLVHGVHEIELPRHEAIGRAIDSDTRRVVVI
ncbi:CRISPR-associated endonuclease Cas2 [Enhygromyxa salina]|uniref:CRISPR-associated endoribonuclease Cas2 n=1 Tax=Enhygromyxa salina TaxID=215803 RepID=A0A2S9YMG8_9BACT|nr:CRISPR-associated endoribonuclease Cas2 [Enhygromyxa salina]